MLNDKRKEELVKQAQVEALGTTEQFMEWIASLTLEERAFIVSNALSRSVIVIRFPITSPPKNYMEN